MRVIFMGTPLFAVPALEALIASAHEVVAVYTQPPRRAGRGMLLSPSPTQHIAEKHGIAVFAPESLKSPEAQAEFAALGADVAVVAAYGLLLPAAILAAPRFGCINIHPSDLPRWRGAAPIQRSIMAGDNPTACCIMQMEAGLDTGPVLLRERLPIPAPMNYGSLHDVLAGIGANQVLTVLAQLENGTAQAVPQADEGVTYAAKITKADRVIDWNQPAARVLDHIRGLSPSPAAITVLGNETVKVYVAKIELGNANHPPGYVLDDALLINAACGTALRLSEIQRPNRARQSGEEAQRSFGIQAGAYAKNPIPT